MANTAPQDWSAQSTSEEWAYAFPEEVPTPELRLRPALGFALGLVLGFGVWGVLGVAVWAFVL